MKKTYTTPMMASVLLSAQDILTDSLTLSQDNARDLEAHWRAE